MRSDKNLVQKQRRGSHLINKLTLPKQDSTEKTQLHENPLPTSKSNYHQILNKAGDFDDHSLMDMFLSMDENDVLTMHRHLNGKPIHSINRTGK